MTIRIALFALIAFATGVLVGRALAPAALPGPDVQRQSVPRVPATSSDARTAPRAFAARRLSTIPAASDAPLDDAVLEALAIDDLAKRRRALGKTFGELAEQEGFDAMAKALALDVPSERHLAVNAVMNRLAPDDPQRALEVAQEFRGGLRDDLVRSAIQAMALADPVGALAVCRAMPDGERSCTPSAYRQWAMIAPAEAAAYVKRNERGHQVDQQLYTVFWTWSHGDPDGAMSWLQGDGVGALSDQERLNLATYLVRDDPSYFVQLADSFDVDGRNRLQQERIAALATFDIDVAVSEVSAMLDDPAFPTVAQTVSSKWAQRDPAAAAQWALSLPERSRFASLQAVVNRWASGDPEAARSFVQGLSDAALRKTGFSAVFDGMAEQDSARAFDWLITLSPGDVDAGRVGRAASRFASEQPIAALNMLTQYQSREWAQEGYRAALRELAQKDFAQARQWFARIEDEQLAIDVVHSLASSAARRNYEDALNWAMGLEGGARDPALSAISRRVRSRDQRPAQLIAAVRDSNMRFSVTFNVASKFAVSDPAYARRLIDGAKLPADLEARLREQLNLD